MFSKRRDGMVASHLHTIPSTDPNSQPHLRKMPFVKVMTPTTSILVQQRTFIIRDSWRFHLAHPSPMVPFLFAILTYLYAQLEAHIPLRVCRYTFNLSCVALRCVALLCFALLCFDTYLPYTQLFEAFPVQ